MKKILLIILLALVACKETPNDEQDIENVRKTIINNYEFINNENMADSLTFNRFKTFYSNAFVMGPSEGKPLSNKETILEEWRELFKHNKGKFNLTINRIEVSDDLAYVLYHYDETLTNIKTGELFFEVVQSAVAILKKDAQGEWKFVFLRWN